VETPCVCESAASHIVGARLPCNLGTPRHTDTSSYTGRSAPMGRFNSFLLQGVSLPIQPFSSPASRSMPSLFRFYKSFYLKKRIESAGKMKINDGFMCRARDVEGGSEASPFNIPQCASKRSGGVNAGTKCGSTGNRKSQTGTQREKGILKSFIYINYRGSKRTKVKEKCRCLAL